MRIFVKDILAHNFIDDDVIEELRGHILVWKGHFYLHATPTHGYNIVKYKEMKENDTYVIFKNVDKDHKMVYIHNAASLGFPCFNSFKNAGRLTDNYELDISGIDVPESYTLLENIKYNTPHFPFRPYLPPSIRLGEFIRKMDSLLGAASFEAKLVAIYLFLSIVTNQKSVSKRIIEVAEEYSIYINNDNILSWIMAGAQYVGFKKYTFDNIIKIKSRIFSFTYSGRFNSIDDEDKEIHYNIISGRTMIILGLKNNIPLRKKHEFDGEFFVGIAYHRLKEIANDVLLY